MTQPVSQPVSQPMTQFTTQFTTRPTGQPAPPHRALILDRDGIINQDRTYVYRIADCQFVDGIFPLLRLFTAYGFALVIATNQSGIGRGLYDEAAFQTFMTWMREVMAGEGVVIDALYHCPDHPTEGIGPYRRENPWRKPAPGMFLAALQDGPYAAAACWAIGDRMTDIEAAAAAGIGTRILLDPACTVPTRHGAEHGQPGYWSVPRLAAIAPLLRAQETGVSPGVFPAVSPGVSPGVSR